MTRPVLYIAGPYTYPHPAHSVHDAVAVGTWLMDRGLAWPLIPHLSMMWDAISPRPYADWLALDFALLARCDGLVRLAGVSTGADGETDWCDAEGVPWIALADGWAGDTPSLLSWINHHWRSTACHTCGAAVTVGVDAHDAGTDDWGVELFACGRCCEECA